VYDTVEVELTSWIILSLSTCDKFSVTDTLWTILIEISIGHIDNCYSVIVEFRIELEHIY
jgi:hypothetical protein